MSLKDIVLSESGQKKRDATQGLLWLTRGLEFTAVAIRNSVSDPNQELAASFTNSYNETLTKFHSFAVRPVFKLAMRACPYRNVFYEKLGKTEANESALKEQLLVWLEALENIVTIIQQFLESGNYAKGL